MYKPITGTAFADLSAAYDTVNHRLRFQRLPPARGGTAQKNIIHLANWSQLIHPGPASSLTKFFFGVESVMRVNADSLLIRAAATSTSGTLNDLTTDLIMANNNNNHRLLIQKLYNTAKDSILFKVIQNLLSNRRFYMELNNEINRW